MLTNPKAELLAELSQKMTSTTPTDGPTEPTDAVILRLGVRRSKDAETHRPSTFPKSEADELTSAGIEQGGSFWISMDDERLSLF